MYNRNDDFNNKNFEIVPVEPIQKENYVTQGSLKKIISVTIVASILLGFFGGFISSKFFNSSKQLSLQTSSSSSPIVNTTSELVSVSDVAGAVADTVVEITTEVVSTGSFLRQYISEGAGSGVIISEDGYIITNNHVIKDANKITVTLRNGESYEAKLIATDSKEDVALIKIEKTGLQAVVFADSSALQVGEAAIAIGNPLGQLGGTVTNGIISALERNIVIDGETMNLIQTNAAINPGNSGGGLFNAKGEFIGLVVAKSSGSDIEGLGFAIPSNDVKYVVDQLSEHGYVTGRVDLQMSLIDISSAQTAMMYRVSETGVYISKIESSSNAEKAGFKVGDRIVSINGTKVSTSIEIDNIIDALSVGDNVNFVVDRSGKEMQIGLTLAEYVPNTTSLSSQTTSNINLFEYIFG